MQFVCFFAPRQLLLSAASYKISFTSKSDAVYFVNYDTQTVMYEQNAQKQTNPGALTAVMTAMVTLEYCEKNSIPLETEVTAQSYLFDEFAGLGVTTADVRSGETVRIIDLLLCADAAICMRSRQYPCRLCGQAVSFLHLLI